MTDQTDTPEPTEPAVQLDDPQLDDPIVVAILDMLGEGLSPTFQDVAKRIVANRNKPKDSPTLWRKYMNAAKQQGIHLAKIGRIEIVRKGKAVDPKDFKGIVRLRLPEGD